MSFPEINKCLRTNSSFLERNDPQHHHRYTCVEALPIDMIKDFVISDPLHLLELGIMRKLLNIWIKGTVNKNLQLQKNVITQLDNDLLHCNRSLPSEIHRSVRSVEWLKYWKGSEYRTILLYIGIVVLKKHLRSDIYEHYLYLFCAVVICSVDSYKHFLPVAKIFFNIYVELYKELYGVHSISINVHNLSHVVDNVERFGNLNSISTYPFENVARHLKLKLKQGNKSIEQAALRLSELNLLRTKENLNIQKVNENICLKFPFESSENSKYVAYNYISFADVIFSNKKFGDKWFLTKNGEIVQFKCALKLNEKIFACGSPLKCKSNFFENPIKSSVFDIYVCEEEYFGDTAYCLNAIKSKLCCLIQNNRLIFIPLIHSIDSLNKK